jgi:hypothetical protein
VSPRAREAVAATLPVDQRWCRNRQSALFTHTTKKMEDFF